MSAAHRLVAHYRASMGVFTRHQWALLPAHKESRTRVCAQCESPLRGSAVLCASWQHLVEVQLEEVAEHSALRVSSSAGKCTYDCGNLPRAQLTVSPIQASRIKCRAQTLLEQRASSLFCSCFLRGQELL